MRKVLRGAKIIDCVNLKPLEGYELIIEGDSIFSIKKRREEELPNDEVIENATRKAANALELGNKIGTIEAGKKADLLVVEGNPLQNIQVLRNPYLVIAGGKSVIIQDSI